MTKREKKQLLKEIAQVAEKAFRRGFQQGHLSGIGGMTRPTATEMEVYRWRFAKHAKTHSVGPPGTGFAGRKGSLLFRLECESVSMEAIRNLIRECSSDIVGSQKIWDTTEEGLLSE